MSTTVCRLSVENWFDSLTKFLAIFTERHLEVASAVRAMGNRAECSVCKSRIEFQTTVRSFFGNRTYATDGADIVQDPLTLALCSTPSCYSVSHITCLATKFLHQERSEEMIPRGGRCLSCHTWTLWGDIIKGADRRKFGAVTEENDIEDEDDEDESDMETGNNEVSQL